MGMQKRGRGEKGELSPLSPKKKRGVFLIGLRGLIEKERKKRRPTLFSISAAGKKGRKGKADGGIRTSKGKERVLLFSPKKKGEWDSRKQLKKNRFEEKKEEALASLPTAM